MLATFRYSLRTAFITGIVIVVPVGVTIVLLVMTFRWLDELLAPLAIGLTDRQIPGLGIAITVLIVFGVGLLTTNILGRALVSFGETIVDRIPFVRSVYGGVKQFLELLTLEQRKPFTQVVLLEYPKKGNYTIGFVTAGVTDEIQEKFSDESVNVFVSTLPNPTTGFLLVAPKKDLTMLPLTVEEGLKIVVSGGILYPPAQ